MKKQTAILILLAFLFSCHSTNPQVMLETSLGSIKMELYQKQAPLTVNNFLHYVDSKRYDGAEFYRVVTPGNQAGNKIKIQVVQGGLQFIFNIDTIKGIQHENTLQTGIHHLNGTISMARDKPGSASTEFFICIKDQPELDFAGKRNPDGQGFAAFGKLISGMEIVQKIQNMPADSNQILINKIRIVKAFRID